MKHIIGKDEEIFTENTPPDWLIHKEFEWWWKDYVLELKIGESIKGDFHTIKRIE